jgi:two-component system sensor histidine kinase KdpD
MRPRPTLPTSRALSEGLAATALVALAGAVAWHGGPHLASGAQAMVFLLAVLVAAAAFGLGPGLLAAALAAAIYNFAFLAPRFTLRIGHPQDFLTFAAFFAVALATGWLAGRAKDRARRLQDQAAAMATLLEASRALARAAAPDEAAQALAEQAAEASGGPAVVLLPDDAGLRLAAAPAGVTALSEEAMTAAARAFAAPGPEGASGGGWSFRPLDGVGGRVGVAGLREHAANGGLVDPIVQQGGVALERALLASAAAENEALRQADKLRTGLLNAISHDFRTPLASILGSATTLTEYERALKPTVRRDLLRSIQEDARRLNQHIGALLDMARLEGGALKPSGELTDVREVAAAALRRLQPQLAGREVKRDFARDLSLAPADPVLLEQVLLNLLGNAAAHTPEGSAIEVAAYEDPRCVLVSVEDDGPGIAPAELSRIFEKFHRASAPERTGGLGLGLSIARGFVEAMGGRLAAASPVADGRGARFVISLPKAAPTPRGLL